MVATISMVKKYVKDENGKYKLVNRDQKEETNRSTNGSKLSLEELDARLRKVERVVLDPRT